VEARVLLPTVTEPFVASVEALARSGRVTVVMPSTLDGVGADLVYRLQAAGVELKVFNATPLAVLEAHNTLALGAAIEYELGRVAIPVHFENLRDRIKGIYGFPVLRDGQVRSVLRSSPGVVEIRSDVFKSLVRHRDPETRALISHWASLIRQGFGSTTYDLPQYLQALEAWFAPQFGASATPWPAEANPPVGAWVELRIDSAQDLYWSSPSAVVAIQPTLALQPAALLADLIDGFSQPVDEDLSIILAEQDELRRALTQEHDRAFVRDLLVRFADLWMGFVHRPVLRGQEQKWRGWYLVPEHGPLTLPKLRELQSIVQWMGDAEEAGTLLVDRSHQGVCNAVALLEAGGVTYRGTYSDASKRDLFIRQQKNYLLRLGLVVEVAPNRLAITDRGRQWAETRDGLDLRKAFNRVLGELRWSWCNMPFFSFARDLADASDGYLAYREMFNWVIHAYEPSQLPEFANAIRQYRALSPADRRAVDQSIEGQLAQGLAARFSGNALGHYKTKIRDLQTAFATTGIFELRPGPEPVLVRTSSTDTLVS